MLVNTLDCGSIVPIFDFAQEAVYMKDLKGRFTYSNPVHMQLYGVKKQTEVLGKTDDFFVGREMALGFRKIDRDVFRGKTFKNHMEMISRGKNQSFWNVTTKLPLKNKRGTIVGLIGISRLVSQQELESLVSNAIRKSIQYLRENYSEKVKIEDLARLASLSVSAFERRFLKEVGISPFLYLKRLRFHEACERLAETTLSISQIAVDCGFCDQSYFTAEFKKKFEMTPLHYRKKLPKRTSLLGVSS